MTHVTGLFAFGLLILAIGLLCMGGCAAKPKKLEKKTCPKFEYTRTLIAQVNQ